MVGFVIALALVMTGRPGAAQVYEVGKDRVVQVSAQADRASPELPPQSSGVLAFGETPGIPSETSVDAAPDVPADAITPGRTVAVPDVYRQLVTDAAAQVQVSPELLAALVWQESRWHPAARSTKGAIGLAQLMPATARSLAVDARDPASNLGGAATYLRQLLDRFDGDVEKTLAAYNAGPARIARANGIPAIAETRAYVAAISSRLSAAVMPGAR